MVREITYDDVFDAQRHFRSILDSTARPGKINRFAAVHLTPPSSLNRASALVGFALMDAIATFETINMEHAAAYLSSNTGAGRTQTEEADFIFAAGTETQDILDGASCGTLLYPDTAATLILQVGAASSSPLPGGLQLTLTGPGINRSSTLFVRGLNPDLLLALQARNSEFPMGLDAMLTFSDESEAPCVVGLPRTTNVSWKAC